MDFRPIAPTIRLPNHNTEEGMRALNFSLRRAFLPASRILLGLLFLIAAGEKFLYGHKSANDQNTVYAEVLSASGRHTLQAFEVLLGAWLFSGVGKGWAALMATIALSSYTGVLIASLQSSAPAPCGCFAEPQAIHDNTVIRHDVALGIARNLLLMSCSITLTLRDKHS